MISVGKKKEKRYKGRREECTLQIIIILKINTEFFEGGKPNLFSSIC